MSLLRTVTDALMMRSAYQRPMTLSQALALDDQAVQRIRKQYNGQLTPPTRTRTVWYQSDLEDAERNADQGILAGAAQLMKAAHRDGTYMGVLASRTSGLVRLPKKFVGDPALIGQLQLGQANDAAEPRSLFDEINPPSELAKFAADGFELGVAVGQLIPVEGRDVPVFVRLDPEFLQFRWSDNAWFYNSIAGLLVVEPGDGQWVLHTPGGRQSPWQGGNWRAIGRAYIDKDHAKNHKANWEGKLANPARVAEHADGASDDQQEGWFQAVAAWGVNTVFSTPRGYKVSLLESNGRGWECFIKTIEAANQEMIITVSGQTVTTEGGAAFQSSDIFKSIRADLIQATADDLAFTVNTQILPAVSYLLAGDAGLERGVCMRWDTTPPKDKNSDAQVLIGVATAIKALKESLGEDRQLDVGAICMQYGVPIVGDVDGDGVADEASSDDADIVDAEFTTVEALPSGDSGAAQDTALNGAQVASMVQVVTAVVQGLLPRDAAIAIIKRAFLVDDAQAEEILGTAGQGFTPPAPEPAALPTEEAQAAE